MARCPKATGKMTCNFLSYPTVFFCKYDCFQFSSSCKQEDDPLKLT